MSGDLLSCHHHHHLERISIPIGDCFARRWWKTVILTARSNSSLSRSAPSTAGQVPTLRVTATTPPVAAGVKLPTFWGGMGKRMCLSKVAVVGGGLANSMALDSLTFSRLVRFSTPETGSAIPRKIGSRCH